MKFLVFLVLSCVVIGVLAEPPRFRPARFRFQRQELAPTTTDSATEATTEPSGPYPASGWKPAGEPFTLPNEDKPAEQYGPPDAPYPPSGWKPEGQAFELPKEEPATNYGAPANTYGAPDNTYGAPRNTYGAPDSTDAPTTVNPQAEELVGPVDVQKSVGTYFVLLPNGQLQKVELVTENDVQNMRYTARLQLRDPAPLLVFRP